MPTGHSYFHQKILGDCNRERAARERELGVTRTVSQETREKSAATSRENHRLRKIKLVEELGLGHQIYRVRPLDSGYILVSVVDHPIWGTRSISLHRLIAGEKIGRRLTKDEEAHHRDHDKRNNDPSNIEVMGVSDHKRLHSDQWSQDREFCALLGQRIREAWDRRREMGTHKLGPNSDETRLKKSDANRRNWAIRREKGTAVFGLMKDERRLRLRVTKTLLGETNRLLKLFPREPYGPFVYDWVLRVDGRQVGSGRAAFRHEAELAVEGLWVNLSLRTSFSTGFVRGPHSGCWKTQAGRNSRRGKRLLQWVPSRTYPELEG